MPVYIIKEVPSVNLLESGPRMIARTSNGHLWCVFSAYIVEIDPVDTQIYLGHSTDGGETWSFEQVSDWHLAPGVSAPTVAVDSEDSIHIAWVQSQPILGEEVTYRKRAIGGAWDVEEEVSDIAGNERGWNSIPAIAIDSADNIHVVYCGYNLPDFHIGIVYRRKIHGGAWDARTYIDTRVLADASAQRDPAIAIDRNDTVHVLWRGNKWGLFPARYQLIYRNYGGGAWNAVELVTDEDFSCYDNNIAVDSIPSLHCVWRPGNTGHLYYMRRTVAGVWDSGAVVDNTGLYTWLCQVAVDTSDTIHVTYQHQVNAAAPKDMSIKRRRLIGGVWQAIETLVDIIVGRDYWRTMSVCAWHPMIGGQHTCMPTSSRLQLFFPTENPTDAYWFFTTEILPPASIPTVTTLPATGVV